MAQETGLKAQDSSNTDPERMKTLLYVGGAGYTTGCVGLYALWYSNQSATGFHFFNDNRQWMLIDKLGHAYSAFHLSRTSASALQWAGMSSRKAGVYGSLAGFMAMLPIEIMDGFAPAYGASPGDIVANSAGALLYGGQLLLWDEIRIRPKFSFHTTGYAAIRPNTLGNNLPAQILKDYNGQTHWFSADLEKFLPEGNKFPKWLNLAAGYGAEGMVYGQPEENHLAGYYAVKQFYFGPDIDLSGIKTKNRLVKALLFVLEGVRLPSPALEINKNRIRLHPVYF